ncbi:MAG: DMT family transporter, partial [Planctomycetia bacterium]
MPSTVKLEARPMNGEAVSLAVLCMMLWGGNSVAVKFSLGAFPPVGTAGLRFLLGAVAIGVWAVWNRAALRLDRRLFFIAFVNGVFMFTQIATFNVGTHWSSAIHSVILVNLFPFFTAAASHWCLPGFSLTAGRFSGLVLAFLGVVVMFVDHLLTPNPRMLWGDAVLVVSATIFGVKQAYVKSVIHEIGAMRLVFWEAALSTPMFFAASLLAETWDWNAVDGRTIAAVAYQGFIVSGVCFMLWTALLARHSPNAVSSFGFLSPLFGMAWSAILLHEPVTPALVMGGLLVVG